MTVHMNTARAWAPTILAVAVAALALGGCGKSDDEQIRSAVRDLRAALEKKDAERACGLLGPNAEAQYVAILSSVSRARGCAELVRQSDTDDEDVASARRQVANAKITVRGDMAMLAGSGDEGPIGLRKIDGDWQVDDLLTPSLNEPPRGEKALTRSDAQQIRATALAASDALRRKDFERLCSLMSPGAEAQFIIGGAFAAMFSGADDEGPSTFSCSTMLRELTKLADDDGDRGFLDLLPSRDEVGQARIVIRDANATIDVPGRSSTAMIRLDGRWLFDADIEKPSTAADLKRCWQAAGAKIATRADDLRFADENEAESLAATTDRMSVKGANWRIFYTMDKGGEDPGLFEVLRNPRTADVVAYVKDAADHPNVVASARDCGA